MKRVAKKRLLLEDMSMVGTACGVGMWRAWTNITGGKTLPGMEAGEGKKAQMKPV